MVSRGFLTDILSSRTLTRVSLYALCVGAYGALAPWLQTRTGKGSFASLPSDLHAMLTLVLGCLLVFRTNTSYSRWWEARTLWGSLVNTSRNLSIKVADLVRAEDEELNKCRTIIVSFCYALRDHLRAGADLRTIVGLQDCHDVPSHVPSYLVTQLYEGFGDWKRNGVIDGDVLRILDVEAQKFLEICGGCERIRNTRLARSYRTFARQCVFLYLATLPWGIVSAFSWWTAPMSAVVAYFMLGLETVAEHVEEPFGHDEDDLDLDGLCRTIETTVNEVFDRRQYRR